MPLGESDRRLIRACILGILTGLALIVWSLVIAPSAP